MWLTATSSVQGGDPPTTQVVSFNDQVRPILARHCFKCHGPDDKARKAKLRLDVGDEAVKPAASGDRPDRPRQARRERAGEPDLRRGRERADAARRGQAPALRGDKQVLKQWIAEGAEYRTHWAFIGRRIGPPPRSSTTRAGPATPSMRSSWPDSRPTGCGPPPEADRADLDPAGLARPGRPAAHARGGRGLRRKTVPPMPTRSWSTGCWPRPITASAGRGDGSTWPAMPTPTATRRTARARSGRTATG